LPLEFFHAGEANYKLSDKLPDSGATDLSNISFKHHRKDDVKKYVVVLAIK
jgi:hypothetical protein